MCARAPRAARRIDFRFDLFPFFLLNLSPFALSIVCICLRDPIRHPVCFLSCFFFFKPEVLDIVLGSRRQLHTGSRIEETEERTGRGQAISSYQPLSSIRQFDFVSCRPLPTTNTLYAIIGPPTLHQTWLIVCSF
ncbi:hypothetical protein LX36DRAFT_75653 [Colletotrichum falcatum]|nr:hypothetical protein LX36DRAFT_75653 [Colletotrichum falcatum]